MYPTMTTDGTAALTVAAPPWAVFPPAPSRPQPESQRGRERERWWAPLLARRGRKARRRAGSRHDDPTPAAPTPPLPPPTSPTSAPHRPPILPPRPHSPSSAPPPAPHGVPSPPPGATHSHDEVGEAGRVPEAVPTPAVRPGRRAWLPLPEPEPSPRPVDTRQAGRQDADGAVGDTRYSDGELSGDRTVARPRLRRPLQVAPTRHPTGGPRPAGPRFGATLGAVLRRVCEPGPCTAAAAGALLWAALVLQARTGAGGAVTVIPTLARGGDIPVYSLAQAVGVAALGWAWWSTLVGLVMSARPLWTGFPSRAVLERTHRGSGLTVVILIFAHAALLVFDQIGDTPLSSFVPGFPATVPGRASVPVGIVAFYLAAALGLSYYLRTRTTRIGPNRWRKAHRFVVLVYVLGVWHALAMGSDLHPGRWAWVLLWLGQPPLAAALLRRWTQPLRASERHTWTWTRPAAATIDEPPPATRTRPARRDTPAPAATSDAPRVAAFAADGPAHHHPPRHRPGAVHAAAPAALPAGASAGAAQRSDATPTYLRRVEAAQHAHLLEQLALIADPDLLAAADATITHRRAELHPDTP